MQSISMLNNLYAVKCNLMESTTKSVSMFQQSVVFAYTHTLEFHVLFIGGILVCALRLYLKRCEEWQLFVQAVFPHPFPPSFHCLFSVMGACFPFLRGGSWLGCQDLPGKGEVSIQVLAANNGSSWMFQAPNLQLAMQLLTCGQHSTFC